MKKPVKIALTAAVSGAVLLLLGSGHATGRQASDSSNAAAASAAAVSACEMASHREGWMKLAAEDPVYFFSIAAD